MPSIVPPPPETLPAPVTNGALRKRPRARRAIWQAMNRLGLTGLHGLPMERHWVDVVDVPMPLAGLDPAMAGFRIAQISDLHYSPVVWRRYLSQHLHHVNDLRPDLVVVTGDLITGGYRYADRIARLLSALHPPHGVVCTFGNHDYSIFGKRQPKEAARRGDHLAKRLRERGLTVLRNEVLDVATPETTTPLALVGLDDLWTGLIDPDKAFAAIDGSRPVVCLNHNPANVRDLLGYEWQWMLAGHTHGRAVATGRVSRRLMPKKFRHYVAGLYAVEGRNLYVNRGLSYGQRVRESCRPEITVFTLECADESAVG